MQTGLDAGSWREGQEASSFGHEEATEKSWQMGYACTKLG